MRQLVQSEPTCPERRVAHFLRAVSPGLPVDKFRWKFYIHFDWTKACPVGIFQTLATRESKSATEPAHCNIARREFKPFLNTVLRHPSLSRTSALSLGTWAIDFHVL